jgi:hypothetical protein
MSLPASGDMQEFMIISNPLVIAMMANAPVSDFIRIFLLAPLPL